MCPTQEPDRRVVWLNRGLVERCMVGGKGASLSRLAVLNARVPPAFALTTVAYQEFANSLGVPGRASDVTDSELPAIRARIEDARLASDLLELVSREFAFLQEECAVPSAFAVRSSATAEDSAEFSFAGLHDTILDVRDIHSLERAITRCWASLWSDRAVTYRRAGGHCTDEAAIAVVVQQLVRSDVSFVVFTADPVSERDHHLVIAASWGLGEAVVSGLVVPDHIVIGPDGSVVEYVIGEKQVMVIPGDSSGGAVREVPVPRALRSVRALTDEQAREVGAVGRDLSGRLGFHADLEGAFVDGVMYLLQARPITTLSAVPVGSQSDRIAIRAT